jgi:hypothetical protein
MGTAGRAKGDQILKKLHDQCFTGGKIPNPKYQIKNKSQITITNGQNIHNGCIPSFFIDSFTGN